jgi:hypothetical protein
MAAESANRLRQRKSYARTADKMSQDCQGIVYFLPLARLARQDLSIIGPRCVGTAEDAAHYRQKPLTASSDTKVSPIPSSNCFSASLLF